MSQNIPVEVLAAFKGGEIKPRWIRLETEEHTLKTIQIDMIYTHKITNFAGFKTFTFFCTIVVNECKRQIQLMYMTESCKWFITQE